VTPDAAAIAQKVAGLRPDWRAPERFYEARSDLADAIRRLRPDACLACPAAALRGRVARLRDLLRHAVAQRDDARLAAVAATRTRRPHRAGQPTLGQGILPLNPAETIHG
jgi:hypothetical protein